jgi:hypothetical protein
MEKQHMETVALFLQAFLGNESSVNLALEQIPSLENMVTQSYQKVNQAMNGNQMQEKKDILRFFKWSLKNGKILESLRLDLNQ